MYVPTVNQKLTLKGLPFQSMLRKKLYDKALEFLKSQTPSGVHLALEQVGPMASGDEEELKEGQGRPLEASSTYIRYYKIIQRCPRIRHSAKFSAVQNFHRPLIRFIISHIHLYRFRLGSECRSNPHTQTATTDG